MKLYINIAFSNPENELEIKKTLKIIKTALKGKYTSISVKRVPLQGLFPFEPLIKIYNEKGRKKIYKSASVKNAENIAKHFLYGKKECKNLLDEQEELLLQEKIYLKQFGKNVRNIAQYISEGGYSIDKIIHKKTAEELFEIIKESKLRERSCIAGYAFEQFDYLKEFYGDKYIICNLYNEDKTSMGDDVLVDTNPHSIIEGMLYSAYITNATKGIIFIKADENNIFENMQRAISEAKENGFLGKHLFKNDFTFDIKIYKGFGSLLLTQNSTVLNAINTTRIGETKPNTPIKEIKSDATLIFNAETFASIAYIFSNGLEKFKNYGLRNSYGTKLITLSGNIIQKGVFEVELGTTLKDIIFKYGKGILHNKRLKAVQVGSICGNIIPYSLLKTKFDYDYLKTIDVSISKGSIIALSEQSCIVDYIKYLFEIFQKESCGKCTVGRVGIYRISEMLEKISAGKSQTDDLRILKKLANHLYSMSMCDFGKKIASLLINSIKYFENEFISHIDKKICPAKVCANLVKYQIKKDKCSNCELCAPICPVNAIILTKRKSYKIDNSLCIKCDLCYQICENGAIEKISKGF